MEYDRQRDSQFNFNSLVGMMLTWWTGLGDNINGLIPDFIIQYSFSSDYLYSISYEIIANMLLEVHNITLPHLKGKNSNKKAV